MGHDEVPVSHEYAEYFAIVCYSVAYFVDRKLLLFLVHRTSGKVADI